MASSQVEIASSAPFYCVLRNHNRRDLCSSESNGRTAFQKNLKDLVRDHHILHTDENLSPDSRRHAQVLDRWARAREMVTPIDNNNRREKVDKTENCPTQSDKSVEIPNLGGVSSLVQKWRAFAEAKVNQKANPNNSIGSNNYPEFETCESVDERFETRSASVMTEDLFVDWESDRTAPSGPPSSQASFGESERLRVADVIKKLTSEKQLQGSLMSWKNENDQREQQSSSLGNESFLPRLRLGSDQQSEQQRCFVPLIGSSRIRGRQAFNDLLMQLERDRHKELESLVERHAVSKFSHRGRIQALLRLRFLRRNTEAGYQQYSPLMPAGVQQKHSRREALAGDKQISQSLARRDPAIGAEQHSCHEAIARDQRHSHSTAAGVQKHSAPAAAVVDQQHSHSKSVGGPPPQQRSCLEGVVRNQQILCHEARGLVPGAQQHLDCEASVGPQQYLHSTTTKLLRQHSNSTNRGAKQHLHDEAGSGSQQHSPRKETVGNQQQSHSKAVGVQQNSHSEVAIADTQHSQAMPSESSQPRQGSTVVLLREKFNVRVEHNPAYPKISRGFMVNNTPDVKKSSTREEPHHPQVNTNEQLSTASSMNSVSYTTEDVHGEPNPSSIWESTNHEVCNLDSQESADRLTTSNGWEETLNAEEQEADNRELTATNDDMMSGVSHQEIDWNSQASIIQQQLLGTDQDWISDVSRPWSDWDEQEGNNQEIIGANNDWITDISRPRSDWEGLRQARYEEMLDPYLDNEDIRKLLERRSVSTFLSSNLREKMDQLMMSRAERLPHPMNNQQEEEQDFHNRLEQLMRSHIQRQTHTLDNQEEEEEEEEDEEEEEEEEEEESPIRHNYSEEIGDHVERDAAGVRSWSHDGDDDEVASPSSQQPRSSQSSYPGTRPCSSFTNRSSIEVELIYDLRGHMEQLHHEISELRKSIKSCMNMQVKMQRSIKMEVAAAVSCSAVRERRLRKDSPNRVPRKGSCCVCYKTQVDSLLYRCGHMCTCFNCALELQWTSGKCPICRAPIMDVVRAYANDS